MIYINYIIKSKKTVRRSYNLIKKSKKIKKQSVYFIGIARLGRALNQTDWERA